MRFLLKGSIRPHHLGFILLSATVLMLHAAAAVSAFSVHPLFGMGLAVVFAVLNYGLAKEAVRIWCHKGLRWTRAFWMKKTAAVLIGVVLTYGLSVYAQFGAVAASAVVGLAAAVLWSDEAVAVYCGSFAGMSCAACLDPSGMAIGAILTALVFLLAQGIFAGVGGGLGTIAYAGCMGAALMLSAPFQSAPMPKGLAWIGILAAGMLGAVLTVWLTTYVTNSAVASSAVVGLSGALLIPIFLPDAAELAVPMIFCASFVGMSTVQRLRNTGWAALAGLLAAVVFSVTLPMLGGAGGKLGTIAFGAVIVIDRLAVVFGSKQKTPASDAGVAKASKNLY